MLRAARLVCGKHKVTILCGGARGAGCHTASDGIPSGQSISSPRTELLA